MHLFMAEMKNAYKIWSENQKRPLGRPRRRWGDIRRDLRKTGL
jgi:hypothetical protein